MIFDFGCHDAFNWSRIGPAFGGSLAVAVVVMGLALLGRLLTRSASFQPVDIYCGWGVVAAVMTVTAILFDHALSYAAYGVFVVMAIGFCAAFKSRYLIAPFWFLLLFPGVLILTIINLSGVGSWDDFAHWALNEIFLFQNGGIPSRSVVPHFSMHPLYPYGLPFLGFLASKLAGGLVIQGVSMVNFAFLLVFAAMLAEGIPDDRKTGGWDKTSLTLLALLFVTLANPAFYPPDMINNTGDIGTAVLTATLGLLLGRLLATLKSADRGESRRVAMQAALCALAFMLVKEVDVFLLGMLGAGFLIVAAKNRILKKAFLDLLVIVAPALVMRLIWQLYVDARLADPRFADIRGYVFTLMPLANWHVDQLNAILTGMRDQIMTHAAEFIMLALAAGYGVGSLFRPSTPLRDIALLSCAVGCGYAVFLFVAYLGSSFNYYEVQSAASFARYMAHVSLLAMAALWLTAMHVWEVIKPKLPLFVSSHAQKFGPASGALVWLALLAALGLHKEWFVPQPNQFVCNTRLWGRAVAAALPDGAQLAVINPEGDYLFSRIINFELAEEEIRTGHYLNMPWHITLFSPNLADVKQQFGLHPETNALFYTKAGYELLAPLGFADPELTFFQLREGSVWKPVWLKENGN